MEKKDCKRINNPVLDRVKDLHVEEDLLVEKATARGSYVKVVLLLLALFLATGISWFMQISPRSLLLLVFATTILVFFSTSTWRITDCIINTICIYLY